MLGNNFEKFHPVSAPQFGGEAPTTPSEQDTEAAPQHAARESWHNLTDKPDDYGNLFEDKALPAAGYIILTESTLSPGPAKGSWSSTFPAHGKGFSTDRFLAALTRNAHTSQEALSPVQVAVGAQNRLIFDEHAPRPSKSSVST